MRGISRSTARGLVMPATLILLLLSATGTLVLLQVAQAEQRFTGNLQQQQQTRLLAEAILRQLTGQAASFDRAQPPGGLRCQPGGGCGRDDLQLSLPEGMLPTGLAVSWEVIRLAPQHLQGWPFRLRESRASSAEPERLALFEARVVVDARRVRGGRTRLAQGVLVPVEREDETEWSHTCC